MVGVKSWLSRGFKTAHQVWLSEDINTSKASRLCQMSVDSAVRTGVLDSGQHNVVSGETVEVYGVHSRSVASSHLRNEQTPVAIVYILQIGLKRC